MDKLRTTVVRTKDRMLSSPREGRARTAWERLGPALLVGASLVLSAGAARASAALVQNDSATGTTPVVATWATAVTAGHLLVATVSANGAGAGGDPTITAPAGWTKVTSSLNPTKAMVAIYYIENCATKAQNSTETFTTTNSAGTTVRLMEFSGVVTSGSLDTSGAATGGSTDGSVSTSANVSTSPSLGVAIFAHQISGTPTYDADAPYLDVGANLSAGGGSTGVGEDSTYNTGVTAGGLGTATVTGTGGTHSWAAAVAVFKEAPLYWIGKTGSATCPSGGSFTSTACWSTTSGGASAGVAPGTSDRANFDGGGTGNCALGATVAGSISMTSAYTGTITQGAQNLALASDLTVGGGTFNAHAGQTLSTNQSGSYNGGIVVSGGTFNGNGATLAVQTLFVSSGTFTAGTGNFSTNNSGLTTLSGGTTTFSSGTVTFAGLVTLSGGSAAFGSGAVTMAGGLDVEGASVTFGASASTTAVTGTVTVGAGTVTFANGTAATDFSNTLLFTQSGGTVNVNGATVAVGSTITTGSNDAFLMSGGTFNNTTAGGVLAVGTSGGGGGIMDQTGSGAIYNGIAGATETFNGPLKVSGAMSVGTATMAGTGVATRKDVTINTGGTLTLSSAGFSFTGPTAMTIAGTLNAGAGTATFSQGVTVSGSMNGSTGTQKFNSTTAVSGTYDGSTATQQFADAVTVTGTLKTGTASMTGGSAATRLVTVSAGGTMTLSSAGFAFNSTTAMPIDGTLNLAGTVSFAGAVALTGALNARTATTTLSAAVTMTGTSTFGGGTGTTTFAVAPVLTAGTFTVGDAGSTGSVILSAGATFTSGMTLAFPTSGGALSAPGGQALAINGTVTSSAGSATTPPKIARSSGATGITISFGATSVLNVNGLEFDNSIAAGVSIASGATYTLLERLAFKNNLGGASSTHLVVTLGSSVINVPGCSFDNTAAHNVELDGTGAGAAPRAIFEKNAALNGALAGETFDLDSNNDGVGENPTTSPYFGSVVEWVVASPADTAGAVAGYPTAAFDWNTFAYYGIYVAYKDTGGAGTPDLLWQRNDDGTAHYSFSVPQTSGDIVGTPFWTTANETTAHVDVNGDGDQLDADVRVVYIGTSLGHIIKLIDNGSSLARPASGPWAADFTDVLVSTITSPLLEDGTNVYFGGTGSATTKLFGVQVSSGANEAKLQKNIGSVSAVTTTPSWTTVGTTTYVYLGSTATAGQAYIYRVNMTTGMVESNFSAGLTTSVNDAVVLVNGRAYAATDGGRIYALDALNFNSGGFVNVSGFPVQTTAAKPIKLAPWIDHLTNNAYFGDDGGSVYALTSGGANLTGFPLSISGSIKITSSPLYLEGGGVIAVGANDGYLYFIDRSNGTVPTIFKRYFASNGGSVSSVSYDNALSAYMVATSDGKLTFINGADVTDPTPGTH
jgi:hypothetical protein